MRPHRIELSHPAALAALAALTAAFLVVFAFASAPARAAIFGTAPLNIAVGPNGEAANAASGGPDISGDDRSGRLVLFHSDASNLVPGDVNGQRDVFVWRRPAGFAGLELNQIGQGSLSRVSVGPRGRQANGPSQNPSVDGSLNSAPHCVAFESKATNLAKGDSSSDSDIYLRNLRSRGTVLISKGVHGDASAPSIAGDCRHVAFTAGRAVWTARPGDPPQRVGPGTMPDYSLDGDSLAYRTSSGGIKFVHSGHSANLGKGTDPIVSDDSEGGGWAVGFNDGGQVKLAVIHRSGGKRLLTLAGPDAVLGGVTAYAANRGIVTYAVGATLFYLNRNSGVADDIANANEKILEAAASARANFAVFTSTGGSGFVEPAGRGSSESCTYDPDTDENVCVITPAPAGPSLPAIYVKHLVDGKPL